jgi:hypothetical protein
MRVKTFSSIALDLPKIRSPFAYQRSGKNRLPFAIEAGEKYSGHPKRLRQVTEHCQFACKLIACFT